MKLALKNVIKQPKGSFNNIFQDSFDKILSQQLTHDRSYTSNPNHSVYFKTKIALKE